MIRYLIVVAIFLSILWSYASIIHAQCTLEWPAVSGADDYDIFHEGEFVGRPASSPFTCTQLGVTPDNGDVFCIQASNDGGNSSSVCVTYRKPFNILNPVQIERPDYLQSYVDNGFTVTRITGDLGTAIAGSPGLIWGNNNRHFYSKRQAFNSDESLILIRYNEGGSGVNFLLDAATYNFAYSRTLGLDDEAIWHNTDPDIIFYITGTTLWTMDVPANGSTLIKTFTGYDSLSFGDDEGNFSNDSDIVVFTGVRTSDSGVDAFAYKISTDTKYTPLDLGATAYDWASISPLGTYIVVEYSYTDTKVYDINGSLVSTFAENATHQDLGIDHLGREVAMGQTAGGIYEHQVVMHVLSSGALVAPIHSGGYVSHTSMRNIDQPGEAIVSIYPDSVFPIEPPYDNEMLKVFSNASTPERIVKLRTSSGDYFAESHPSPSPSGRKILFASDWEEGRPVHLYVVDYE